MFATLILVKQFCLWLHFCRLKQLLRQLQASQQESQPQQQQELHHHHQQQLHQNIYL